MEPLADTEPLTDADPRRVGPFTLTGRLGAESVGTVFHGRSASGRQVAVTVVHERLARDAEFRTGFARDVAAARAVSGFSTAQVVDADPDAELPWIATRYVAGPSLADGVRRSGPLPVAEVATLAAAVAEALEAIHLAGLVHGALRPGAVILSAEGPQVVGLGTGLLAERPESSEYLPPERIRAEPVGPAADVFALGGLLCFAATGRPPFGSGLPEALADRVLHAEPDVPVSDRHLRDLVTRCLAKDPAARPTPEDVLASATALRAVAGETVRARVVGPGGVPPTPTPTPDPAEPPTDAPSSLPPDEPTAGASSLPLEEPAAAASALAEPAAVAAPVTPGEPPAPRRRALLVGGAVAAGVAVMAGAEGVRRLWGARTAPSRPLYTDLLGHTGMVLAVAYAPDGATLATAASNSTASIWDAATGAERARLVGLRQPPKAVMYAPDSRTVVTGGSEGTAVVWDAASGTALRTIPVSDRTVESVAFFPDGARLATGGGDGTVRVWNVRTGALTLRLRAAEAKGDEDLRMVAVSPDGSLLATVFFGVGQLWDARTGALRHRLEGGWGWATFSPDGATLATGWSDKQGIALWDVRTGTVRRRLLGHVNGISTGAFSPDGRSLLTASYDGTYREWDVASGATRRSVNVQATVLGIAVSPDGKAVASAGQDGVTKIWDASDGRLVRALPVVRDRAFGVSFAPDGRTLATCGGAVTSTARIWDAADGRLLHTLSGHRLLVVAVAYAPDSRTLATASGDGDVKIWDVATGTSKATLSHPQSIYGVRFAPDGRSLATYGPEGTLRIWDPATGAPVRAVPLGAGGLGGLDYSPDGSLLAAVGGDNVLRLVDPRTGREVRAFRGLLAGASAVRFAPDGATLGTAGGEPTVRIWDARTGSTLVTLVGHLSGVFALDFAPRGRLVATGSTDRTVRLWDRTTGENLRTLTDFRDTVYSVAFAPDGRTLVTSCWDGSIRRWDLAAVLGKALPPP